MNENDGPCPQRDHLRSGDAPAHRADNRRRSPGPTGTSVRWELTAGRSVRPGGRTSSSETLGLGERTQLCLVRVRRGPGSPGGRAGQGGGGGRRHSHPVPARGQTADLGPRLTERPLGSPLNDAAPTSHGPLRKGATRHPLLPGGHGTPKYSGLFVIGGLSLLPHLLPDSVIYSYRYGLMILQIIIH